ncbi:MAG: hypothetical protein LBH42_09450 [Treponema sp.]|jgi:hypothetical protein|nr:hypothetical protein [Treponema sp.]
MKRKIISFLLLMILMGLCPLVFSLSLEDLVGPFQSSALLAGEKPVLVQFKDPRPGLLPGHKFLTDLVETIQRNLDPGIMVETLHVYEKPPNAEKTAWSSNEEINLYNNLLALSTLAGLKYYSASRGTIRTFYETSSVIDGPATKKLLPDPVYPRPQAELTMFARQRDSTFGDNIYQYDYYSAPGGLIFIQQNLTALNAGIIPAVGKNRLRSVVAVLDAGNYILVYAASMAKAASIPGMRERVGNSFANRAEAITNWFRDQADKAFLKVN